MLFSGDFFRTQLGRFAVSGAHAGGFSLVQWVILLTKYNRLLAVGQAVDVTVDETEVGPLGGWYQGLHFVQVALAGRGLVANFIQ